VTNAAAVHLLATFEYLRPLIYAYVSFASKTSSQKGAGAYVRRQHPEQTLSDIFQHAHFPPPTPKYAEEPKTKRKCILQVSASNEKTHYTSTLERLWEAAAGSRKQVDIRLASQQTPEVQPRIMAFGGL
jgi:hypothetical protein